MSKENDEKPFNNDDIAMATGVVRVAEIDIVTYIKPTVVTSNRMAQSVPIVRTTETTTSTLPVSQSVPPMKYSTPTKPQTEVEDPTEVDNPYPLTYIGVTGLGRDPCRVNCPSCHQYIFTNVRSRSDAATWIIFILVLILFWPLCWLPFVLPSCQSTDHICPSCRRIISTTRACE